MTRRRTLQIAIFAAICVWVSLTNAAQARAATTGSVAATEATSDPGFFAGSQVLLLGGLLTFLALAITITTALTPERKVSLMAPVGGGGARASRANFGELSQRFTKAAERTLDRNGRRGSIDTVLEQAGISMRAGELVVLVAVASGIAFLLGVLMAGVIGGVLFAVGAILGARSLVLMMRTRRRKAFENQLDDTLQLLAGSLRAGYGLMQAIETSGRELESPAADEFRRLSTEVRLGRDVVDSLDAMASRVDSEDFEWVAQAIRIHREVGGDLTEVLDRVAETIRARHRLRRQVKTLAAEGRLSAIVLFALPFVMGGLLMILNPGYLGELFASAIGIGMLVGGGTLLLAGGLWLRKLIRPVF